MLKQRQNRRRNAERGSVLALATIGMLAFLLAAGLCIDISHLYLVGTELQNAADAAALAGASALNSTSKGITTATDRAVALMNKYEFNGADVTIARSDVRFAVNVSDFDGGGTGMSEVQATATPQNIRFVKVTVPPKSVGVFFAASVIGSTLDLSRNAVAGQSVGVNKICNFASIVIIEDSDGWDDLDIVNPAQCPNTKQYTVGCTYNLHLAPPCDAQESTYFVLDAPTERCLSTDIKKRIALGVDGCYSVGDVLNTIQHQSATPIRQGFNTRLDTYVSGLDPEDFPPDLNVKTTITYAQYKAGSLLQDPLNPGAPDKRILILPIIKSNQFNPDTFTVTLNKFGVFFLQRKSSGSGTSIADLRVEYIADAIVVGNGSYSPGGPTANAQITVPVLYR